MQLRQQREAIVAQLRVVSHYHDLLEEGITGGRSCASRPSALAYSPCATALETASRNERIASNSLISAASRRPLDVDFGTAQLSALRSMLLCACWPRPGWFASGSSRKALNAFSRMSKSSGDARFSGQHCVKHLGAQRPCAGRCAETRRSR